MTCFVEIALSTGTRPASYFRAGMFSAEGLFHCEVSGVLLIFTEMT